MNPKSAVTSEYHQACDEEVWKAFKGNSKEAFAILYYRYFNMLLQKGLQISGDRELVKDSIHDLFLEIWKNKMRLSSPVSVKAYLVVSLQRKIIRHLKKFRTQQSEIESLPVGVTSSKEEQIISEQVKLDQECMVSRAVSTLTKRQKEAIHLKFYENLSYEEIAGMMKISTYSIYNLVSKAIDNMQQGITKEAEPRLL